MHFCTVFCTVYSMLLFKVPVWSDVLSFCSYVLLFLWKVMVRDCCLLRITTIALFSSECSGIAELIDRERACKFTAPHCPGVEVCTLCLKKNSTLATFKIYRFKL